MAFSVVKLIGLTRGQELHEAYILIFEVQETQRMVPIFVDREEFEMVEAAMQSGDYAPTGLMNRLARRLMLFPQQARILRPDGGDTSAMVDYDRNGEQVSLCLTVGEAMVWANQNQVPVVMSSDYINAFSRMADNSHAVKVPVDGMPTKLLQEAIETAVKEDNFELASRLRDELAKR